MFSQAQESLNCKLPLQGRLLPDVSDSTLAFAERLDVDVSGPCLQPRLLLIGSITDWALRVSRNELLCIKHCIFIPFIGLQVCIVF